MQEKIAGQGKGVKVCLSSKQRTLKRKSCCVLWLFFFFKDSHSGIKRIVDIVIQFDPFCPNDYS